MNTQQMDKVRHITATEMMNIGRGAFQRELPVHPLAPIAIPHGQIKLEDIELYTVGEDISLETLFQSRQSYGFPDFQRESVWTLPMQQSLIDSVFRSHVNIPSLELFEEMTGEESRRLYTDGGQRFRALMGFRENRFPTFSKEQFERASRNSGLPLIEPKRLFSQMTIPHQNIFKSKTIHLMVTRAHGNVSFEQIKPLIADAFRCRQNERRLTTAETLWSYPSKAKAFAENLSNHPVWAEIYQQTLRTKQRQRFELGLYTLALHLHSSPVSIRVNELEDIACGFYDAYLTDDLLLTMNLFLERLQHVFSGVKTKGSVEAILFIQACQILEQDEGFALGESEKGCLSDWFYRVRGTLSTHYGGGRISQFGYMKVQQQFWDIEKPRLLEQPGLVRSLAVL